VTGVTDWQTAPLDELVKHIVGTHHEYLKLDLPVLGHRMDKVASVHGARDPKTLPRMAEVFAALRAEMEVHMHKEETILFPFIEQYGRAEVQNRPMPPVPFGSIANPIAMMERETCERRQCPWRNTHANRQLRTASIRVQYGAGTL
jgi:regulator of cell morphogenesis and NO signaling